MAGPRLLVDTPGEFTPLSYGLLSVAEPATPDNNHWVNGVTYEAACIVTGGTYTTYDECVTVTGTGGAPPTPGAKADNVAYPALRGATPFTVYAEFDCSPVGVADATAIATAALEQVESWQVERAVWTGQAAGQVVVYPHLSANSPVVHSDEVVPVTMQTAAVTVTGSPVKMSIALGLLEEQLALCAGGVGVIHIARHALPVLAGAYAGLLEADEGGRLHTTAGNMISAGAGYTGSSPAGAARTSPTQTWIYATGPLFAYRSQVRILGEGTQLNRSENTRSLIAERTYVVGWGCCHFAALVDLTG